MTRPSHHIAPTSSATPFLCAHCGSAVMPHALGTAHRNHCPRCLWSIHVDHLPGDRRCTCRGPMRPIGVWVQDDGEWALIHRCCQCFSLHTNRIAGDDDPAALVQLASGPLQNSIFIALSAQIGGQP